jgi:hypothetical protein
LDQAYDEGGAGVGSDINADAGPVTIIGTGAVTPNEGRLHVTSVGGTIAVPSASIYGLLQTNSSVGFGVAGEITNADNPGAAISAASNGTGQAFSAIMTGTGAGGLFQVNNAASPFSAVSATTNGSGTTLQSNTSGTGRAGEFNNLNASNASNEIMYVSTNSTNGYAMNVENTAAAGAGLYHTMRVVGSQSNGVAIMAGNFNTTGTAIVGYGNNQPAQSLAGGSGGAFNGYDAGIFARYNSPGVGQGMTVQDGFGAQWTVGAWDGAAYRKIAGTGTVNTVVEDLEGKKVMLCAPEAPENLFEDYGSGELINGEAIITMDPIFSKNIEVSDKHPLRVFIQLEGDCEGVFVTDKTASGFKVKELKSGTSNVSFTYHVIGNRANEVRSDGTPILYADERFPDAKELEEVIELTESGELGSPTQEPKSILKRD